MNDFGWLASTWLLRTLAAGGALLLLAWLALQFTRNPARRQRLAAWTFRGAVLAAILGFFPAWLTIPISMSEPQYAETAKVIVEPRTEIVPEEIVPEAPLAAEEIPLEAFAATIPEPEPLPALPLAAAPPANLNAEPAAESRVWYPWLLGAYGAIAILAAIQLLIALMGLIRLRRSSSPAPEHIVKLARVLAAPIGAMPQVRISTRIASPVCFGWRRPIVLLPEALLKSARAGELRWVLAHELDHLRRGDPRTGLWVGLARVLYFVVPWFWAVRRELRLAQEYLADAAAAAGRPADYAAFLVSLSHAP